MVAMFAIGLGRNEQSFRGTSIYASYQVATPLAKRFQKRSFLS
jgi:hypothetical protein